VRRGDVEVTPAFDLHRKQGPSTEKSR